MLMRTGTMAVAAVVLLTAGGAAYLSAQANPASEGRPVRVALLTDAGCTDGKSREAAWKVLSAADGITADRVSTETLLTDRLNEYDVIIFPGGAGGGQASLLGVEGGRAVSEFVRSGKGAVGICAGGYLIMEGWGPATQSIELVNAQNWAGQNGGWARGERFIAMKTLGRDAAAAQPTSATAAADAAAGDEATSRTMWYENGPIFVQGEVTGLEPYTPLVRFATDLTKKGEPEGQMIGRDAVIAAPFGKGRTVAFSTHPELSPGLEHWLVNAVKWSAAGNDGAAPTVETVLEGRK